MIKRTIKYLDFNGNPQVKEAYFNLSKAELLELEISEAGGYGEMLKRMAETENPKEVFAAFKTILLKSYGIKSDDGESFVKNDAIREAFENSAAFDELVIDLVTNADSAAVFFNGIIPADMTQELEMEMKRIANPQLPPPPPAV